MVTMNILINNEPYILTAQINNLLIYKNIFTNKLTFKYINER